MWRKTSKRTREWANIPGPLASIAINRISEMWLHVIIESGRKVRDPSSDSEHFNMPSKLYYKMNQNESLKDQIYQF